MAMSVRWPVGLAMTLMAGSVTAAPLPPMTPVSLCGDVVGAMYQAEQHLDAVPGASGSLGRPRLVPAHYRVVLVHVTGIDAATLRRLTLLAGPRPGEVPKAGVLLLIGAAGRADLGQAAALCITRYRVSGDEGLTLTTYDTLTVDKAK
jgi:hypothetical protein